ncbi:MAG: hypothetical protein HY699_20020 [Deltaproteobacteria bacterium]|nr:hypothetical protein [Deltaproteobacteria bacterium]
MPEFGGMFLSENQQALEVYLTDTSAETVAAARTAIIDVFGAAVIRQGGIRPLHGEYGFLQLREWYTTMAGPVLGIPGVAATDIDEAVNRLQIALETPEVEAAVLEQIAALAIPRNAVVTVVTGPTQPLVHTLRDTYSPRQGGYVITRLLQPSGIASCTLGANALSLNAPGFVTNSHCTASFWGLDGTNFYQACGFYPAQLIGLETLDPPGFTGLDSQHSITCPAGFRCRYSDSAFAKYNSGIQWDAGLLARTTGLTTWDGSTAPSGCPPSTTPGIILTADHSATFRITAPPSQPYLHGLKLNKVGITTGWTSGSIEGTCADYTDANKNVRLCQYTVGNQTDSDPLNDNWRIATFGDSGSPVFRIHDSQCGYAELYGVLWGGNTFNNSFGAKKFVFSPIGGVSFQQTGIQSSKDLGPLNYLAPPGACGCVQPPSGLVAWWPLDEAAGAVDVVDIVAGHNGTPQPGGAVGAPNGPDAVSGQVAGALQMGVGRYVEADANLNFDTSDFSLDAWVKFNPTTQTEPIVHKLDSNGGYFLYLGATTSGGPADRLYLQIGSQTFSGPQITAATGTWIFVAATRARLYVGQPGFPLISAGISGGGLNASSNTNLLIGGWTGNPHAGLAIDELEIFDRSLAEQEIQDIFDAGAAGKCKAEICAAKFHDLDGDGVQDLDEPPLFGWTFDIADSQGNLMGSVTTDREKPPCLAVAAPGTYTATEQLQSGWTPTTLNPQTATVVSPGEIVNLSFGNKMTEGCDLTLAKTIDPDPPVAGQPFAFVVAVTNVGSAPCPPTTTVTDTLPSGFEVSPSSFSPNSAAGWVCTAPPGITCTNSSLTLPPPESIVVFSVVGTAAEDVTRIQNCAAVANADDTNSANNRACVTADIPTPTPVVSRPPTATPTPPCDDPTSVVISSGRNAVPVGGSDQAWSLIAAPSGTTGSSSPRPATVIASNPAWTTLPDTQWISANTECSNTVTADCPAGTYSYELCWEQCGALGSSPLLQVLADNTATASLDKIPLATSPAAIGFTTSATVLGFNPGPGTHSLQVDVHNNPFSGGGGTATGMNFSGTLSGAVRLVRCPSRPCVGDCDSDGYATVNELITMVNIALGNAPVSACANGDADGSGDITVDEIVAGVVNALDGCPLARAMEGANQVFRAAVASALLEAAQQAMGQAQQIAAGDFVAIPADDDANSIVVNSRIVGVEDLTLDKLAEGADVLFTFLRLPEGSALPSGFYTVRIFRTPGTARWRAQFTNLQGRVALETDAQVGPEEPTELRIKLTGEIDFDAGTAWIDLKWKNNKARVGLHMGTGGADPTSLPPAGQRIVEATTIFQATINNSKSNNFRLIIGTRDDILISQAIARGVESLTMEQLAQGQDVFSQYYRGPETDSILPGFYVVRILRNPAGQWLAQVVNMQGRVVKEDAVMVESHEPAAGVLLSLDVSVSSTTTSLVLPQGIAIRVSRPWAGAPWGSRSMF